ncbi:hypothetical protein [Sphingobium xenophagum]|uniref:hypothetical protein n=1 Tax=Sphingobium xenophagum TaxID=121428 RepID=UPI000475F84B|nr:hypothetical protein [Sphingobium xenophagum]
MANAPKLEARCYVVLALLGDGEGEQRWNPKEWWPHALIWFDLYCPELGRRLAKQRWAYLLAAYLQITKNWLLKQPEGKDLITTASYFHDRAKERLDQMTRGKQLRSSLSALSPAPPGFAVDQPDVRWRRAGEELVGPQAETVEMLHFLHVLHSQLGVAQHSPDERYATRTPFYQQVQQILQQGTGLPDDLHAGAQRLAQALSATVLLAKDPALARPRAALANALPDCFQIAHHLTRCPPRTLIEAQLAHDPIARDKLMCAYDLGLAVADLAMDIFHSGAIKGPAFRPGAYDYLHSLVRYGPKMAGEQAKRSALRSAMSEVPDRPLLTGMPMTRAFAERMRGGLLAEPARAHLSTDLGQ